MKLLFEKSNKVIWLVPRMEGRVPVIRLFAQLMPPQSHRQCSGVARSDHDQHACTHAAAGVSH